MKAKMRNGRRVLFTVLAGSAVIGSAALPVFGVEELECTGVIASSTLPDEGSISYDAENVIDYDRSTAWVEDAKGDGLGEYLEFYLSEGAKVTGGTILPGYYKDEGVFWKNSAPAKLLFTSGEDQSLLDVSDISDHYDAESKGFRFTLNPPIYSDGAVRVEILDAREGWLYEDNCISELHLYGEYEIPEIIELEGPDIENPPEDKLYQLADMAKWVYQWHTGKSTPENDDIIALALSSDDKAFLLYWYQYNVEDHRINDVGEYNSISTDAVPKIMKEIVGTAGSKDVQTFYTNYAAYKDAASCLVHNSGDFGDAGSYYFDDVVNLGMEDGRLRIAGTVKLYNGYTYKKVKNFTAWFIPEDHGSHFSYQFYEVKLHDETYTSNLEAIGKIPDLSHGL